MRRRRTHSGVGNVGSRIRTDRRWGCPRWRTMTMSRSPSSSSSNEPGSEACFTAVSSLLEELGARWTVIGAVAAGFYRSTQRATTDVDYLVGWDERLVPGLVDAGFDVRLLEDDGEP